MSLRVHSRRTCVRRRGTRAIVALVRGDVEVAIWPLAGSDRADLSIVEELARLQLAARTLGCSIRLRDVAAELAELLDLVGLSEVLTGVAELGREARGKAEDGEQAGVEEVVMPDDPVA